MRLMRLAIYLENKKISDAAFARSIGVERQAVGRYRTGERFPEKAILRRIFEITGGRVTANDFAGIQSDGPSDPAAPKSECTA